VPSPSARLSADDAADHLRARSFAPSAPCRVGVELEWLTAALGDDQARVDPEVLRRALGPSLPAGSTVTFEPGGQLELSSLPFVSLTEACGAAAADLAVALAAATRAGVRLVGLGADPRRPPHRVVDTPRYRAMEQYFDGGGPAGRRMMCNTAAVQVNVGLGPTAADGERQWRVASAVGPTLAAAFANSPLVDGRPSGFRSARLAAWWAMDPTRTRPVTTAPPGPEAWAAYVLDARVMLVRGEDGDFDVPASPVPTFREWLAGSQPLRSGHAGQPLRSGHAGRPLRSGHAGRPLRSGHAGRPLRSGPPTFDDLDYHVSTLFPPVRPKGWLELRMIDALPDPWWQVPVAVAAALLLDPEAGEQARRAAARAGVTEAWLDAARVGLAAPNLAASAGACFSAAGAGLERLGVDRSLLDAVAAYAERWVHRARTPADDLLDAWSRAGSFDPAGVGSA
jgi:glutamate--cysteine ligase